MIHMKCQDFFPSENRKNKFDCPQLQIFLGTLWVKLSHTELIEG